VSNEMIEDAIYNYVQEEIYKGSAFDRNSNLLEGGRLDSVEIMKFISFLEKRFNIEIELEQVNPDNFANLHTIAAFVFNVLSASRRQ